MVITVDDPVPDDVIETLLETPGFADARAVTL
jgi:hypothetical protein